MKKIIIVTGIMAMLMTGSLIWGRSFNGNGTEARNGGNALKALDARIFPAPAEGATIAMNAALSMNMDMSQYDSLSVNTFRAEIVESKEGKILDIRRFERFSFFQTDAFNAIIRLDTSTGALDIIICSSDRFRDQIFPITGKLVSDGSTTANGTFGIVALNSYRNFLLVNYLSGETWHVIWGTSPERCSIEKME